MLILCSRQRFRGTNARLPDVRGPTTSAKCKIPQIDTVTIPHDSCSLFPTKAFFHADRLVEWGPVGGATSYMCSLLRTLPVSTRFELCKIDRASKHTLSGE